MYQESFTNPVFRQHKGSELTMPNLVLLLNTFFPFGLEAWKILINFRDFQQFYRALLRIAPITQPLRKFANSASVVLPA